MFLCNLRVWGRCHRKEIRCIHTSILKETKIAQVSSFFITRDFLYHSEIRFRGRRRETRKENKDFFFLIRRSLYITKPPSTLQKEMRTSCGNSLLGVADKLYFSTTVSAYLHCTVNASN